MKCVDTFWEVVMNERFKALWPVLAAGILAGALVFGQSDEAAPVAIKWDYKLVAWTGEDTEAAMRLATGDQTSGIEAMATALANDMAPINHPKLQAAVDAHLQAKLQEVGAEGWELTWVRDTTTVNSGYVLPAPSMICKRARK